MNPVSKFKIIIDRVFKIINNYFFKMISLPTKIILAIILLVMLTFLIIDQFSPKIGDFHQHSPAKEAIGKLKVILHAQSMYRIALGYKDIDSDKNCEFAEDIDELIKLTLFQPSGKIEFTSLGEMRNRGYLYKMHTPNFPDDAEKYFCVYAWPEKFSSFTQMTFFMLGPQGEIYSTIDRRYSGPNKGPKLIDAFTGEPFKSPIDTSKWKPID